jgi:N-methylhydantoinase B
MGEIDPIKLEVIREGLISIIREMRVNLGRTAYSSVLYEGHDFSCCLMDGKGQLVAQEADMPAHIFPIAWSVRKMVADFPDIHEGDVFLHNNPYDGGTHLNDVALIYTMLIENELILFPVIRAHWGDVGGMTPGSLSGKTREIFQEGIRIPLMRVYERGRPNQQVLDLLFSNMRVPEERLGDFQAILGTCYVAEKRIREMAERYGKDELRTYLNELLYRAEMRMRQMISKIPDGNYQFESYLDHSGNAPDPLLIRVKLCVMGDSIEVECTGAPSVEGPTNAGPAVTESGVFISLKSLLDPSGAINHGAFRPIQVKSEPGTIVHARYPFPCGGFSEVRRGVEGAVMGAMAQALSQEVCGEVKGTVNHTYIGGINPRRPDSYFVYYEFPSAGTGAFLEGDGNNAITEYSVGDFGTIQPVEAIENEFPLFVERCELRANSGGDGRTRGGLGLRREIRLLSKKGIFSVLSDKNVIPPYGVFGGHSGAPNRFTIIRNGQEIQPSPFPGKVTGLELQEGDIVVECSSGGGGYGDPLERDPVLVLNDVLEEHLTPEKARTRYGVAIEGKDINREETERLRREIKDSRFSFEVDVLEREELEKGRRVVEIGPEAALKMGVSEGDLLECVNPRGASLRVWAKISRERKGFLLRVGRLGLKLLGLNPGEQVDLRKVAEA